MARVRENLFDEEGDEGVVVLDEILLDCLASRDGLFSSLGVNVCLRNLGNDNLLLEGASEEEVWVLLEGEVLFFAIVFGGERVVVLADASEVVPSVALVDVRERDIVDGDAADDIKLSSSPSCPKRALDACLFDGRGDAAPLAKLNGQTLVVEEGELLLCLQVVDAAGPAIATDDAIVSAGARQLTAEAEEVERRLHVNDVANRCLELNISLEEVLLDGIGVAVTDSIRRADANWAVPLHKRVEGCRSGFRVAAKEAHNGWDGTVGMECGELSKCGVVFGEDMPVAELGDEGLLLKEYFTGYAASSVEVGAGM